MQGQRAPRRLELGPLRRLEPDWQTPNITVEGDGSSHLADKHDSVAEFGHWLLWIRLNGARVLADSPPVLRDFRTWMAWLALWQYQDSHGTDGGKCRRNGVPSAVMHTLAVAVDQRAGCCRAIGQSRRPRGRRGISSFLLRIYNRSPGPAPPCVGIAWRSLHPHRPADAIGTGAGDSTGRRLFDIAARFQAQSKVVTRTP